MTSPAAVLTEHAVTFVVLGVPAPQGSKRHVGSGVMVESSKRLKPWRSAVTDAAAEAWAGRPPLDCPMKVRMAFTFARPRSHFGTGKNSDRLKPGAPVYPTTTPDLSKLVRATEDAITDAGVWRDDSRVVRLDLVKAYTHTADDHSWGDIDALTIPGVVVRIWTREA